MLFPLAEGSFRTVTGDVPAVGVGHIRHNAFCVDGVDGGLSGTSGPAADAAIGVP